MDRDFIKAMSLAVFVGIYWFGPIIFISNYSEQLSLVLGLTWLIFALPLLDSFLSRSKKNK